MYMFDASARLLVNGFQPFFKGTSPFIDDASFGSSDRNDCSGERGSTILIKRFVRIVGHAQQEARLRNSKKLPQKLRIRRHGPLQTVQPEYLARNRPDLEC